MNINLRELNKYCDNTGILETFVDDYINSPVPDSISYQTLDELSFLNKNGFDLNVIEEYDIDFYRIVMKRLLYDLIWLNGSIDDESIEDFENTSEEEYMDSVKASESDSDNIEQIDEKSIYYKTLKSHKILSKKGKVYSITTKNLLAVDSEVLSYFVEESIYMINSAGVEHNPVIVDSLKKLNVLN